MRWDLGARRHKWLNGPKGSTFLYARREVQHLLEPLAVSWGWQPEKTTLLSLDSSDSPPSPFVLEQEWQGTRDVAAYLSVPAAIRFQADHDWGRVRQECHELVRYARQAISELTGLEPTCPDSPEWYPQMATIPLPACDAEKLKWRLHDEYRVEVPIAMTLLGILLLFLVGKVVYNVCFEGNLFSLLAGISMGAFAFFALSYTLVGLVPSARAVVVIGNVVLYPLIIFSGAVVPLEVMPDQVLTISRFLPLTHLVALLRGLWFGKGWGDLLTEVAVLTGVGIVGTLIVARTFRWE